MENEKQSGSWKKWIQAILLPLLVAFFSTWLAFYLFQQKHDEEIVKLTAKYAHFASVLNKQMDYTEKMIGQRQEFLTYMRRLNSISSNQTARLHEIYIMGQDITKSIFETNLIGSMYITTPFAHYISYCDDLSLRIFTKYSENIIHKMKYDGFDNDLYQFEKRLDTLVMIGRKQFLKEEEFNKLLLDFDLQDSIWLPIISK